MEGASDVAGPEAGWSPPAVRLLSFGDRTPVLEALGWIDVHARVLGSEAIDVEDAAGRISIAPFTSEVDWPSADCAAVDGYAMRAADSEGAGDYNPLPLILMAASASVEALPPGFAFFAAAGTPLPSGADAILPLDAAQRSGGGMLEVLAPVARGAGVKRRGSELRAHGEAFAGPRRLRPQDAALLAATGTTRVSVTRRPRVHLVVPGPKGAGHDALTPMLRALVARDGGTATSFPPAGAGRTALAQAVARAAMCADLVLVAGRSGAGIDDEAPLAIVEAHGTLDLHGIAMRPGGSTGLGKINGVPVLMLPGDPLACLAAYDLLAVRAVRHMGGFAVALPYAVTDAVLERKVVSAVGSTDLVRVRVAGGRAAPLGAAESGGLVSATHADGFIIVPESSEGYAPGSSVRVHLYDDRRGEAGA
jgi:molybdopterin molybdotransferase